MKEVTRVGTYAIVLKNQSILLTTKVKGPYEDLLDLPGGKIEFGETIETALQRELKEEVGIMFSKIDLFSNFSHSGTYHSETSAKSFIFHHIGLIYLVEEFKSLSNCPAEDLFDWYPLDISKNLLTPFAKMAVQEINNAKRPFSI